MAHIEDSVATLSNNDLMQRLRPLVLDAARAAGDELREQRLNHHWYGYALYTCDSGHYIRPTANSEEGLDEAVRNYEIHYVGLNAGQRVSLRWSPCDWAYHLHGKEHFIATEPLLFELSERFYAAPEDSSEPDDIAEGVFAVCRDVLRQLDAEGYFGWDAEREQITLNVLMGDQSDEQRLQWARDLNPPSVVARLAADFEAAYHLRNPGTE